MGQKQDGAASYEPWEPDQRYAVQRKDISADHTMAQDNGTRGLEKSLREKKVVSRGIYGYTALDRVGADFEVRPMTRW